MLFISDNMLFIFQNMLFIFKNMFFIFKNMFFIFENMLQNIGLIFFKRTVPPTRSGREVLPVVASSVFSTDLDAAAISNDVTIWIFENRFKNYEVTSIFVEVDLKKTTKSIENRQNVLNLLCNLLQCKSTKLDSFYVEIIGNVSQK